MVSYLEQVRQKWACEASIRFVYTTSQANKWKSLSLQNNTVYGILLQAHRGGTSLNGIGSELTFCSNLFVTIGFVYSRWRSTLTDGRYRQIHLTRSFSHALCTSDCAHSHCLAQDELSLKVSQCAFHSILMPSMMLCV